MAAEARKGLVVMFRMAAKYCPALIEKLNPDGSVDLKVYVSEGISYLEENAQQGKELGQWQLPGFDSINNNNFQGD